MPADSPGKQLDSQMPIFSIMEYYTHRRIKLEMPVVAITPPKKQQEFFIGHLVRKSVVKIQNLIIFVHLD